MQIVWGSEQSLQGDVRVAAFGEQIAGEGEVVVAAGGEDERLLLGSAGADEPLERLVADAEFADEHLGGHRAGPPIPSAPSTSRADVIAAACLCRSRSFVPSESADVISPGTA